MTSRWVIDQITLVTAFDIGLTPIEAFPKTSVRGELLKKMRYRTVATPARYADIIRAYTMMTERNYASKVHSPLTLQEHLTTHTPELHAMTMNYHQLCGSKVVDNAARVTRYTFELGSPGLFVPADPTAYQALRAGLEIIQNAEWQLGGEPQARPNVAASPNQPASMLGLTTGFAGGRAGAPAANQPPWQFVPYVAAQGNQPQGNPAPAHGNQPRVNPTPQQGHQPQANPGSEHGSPSHSDSADPSTIPACKELGTEEQIRQDYPKYRAAAEAAGWQLDPYSDDLADMCQFNAQVEAAGLQHMTGGADPQDQWTTPKGKGPSRHQRRNYRIKA